MHDTTTDIKCILLEWLCAMPLQTNHLNLMAIAHSNFIALEELTEQQNCGAEKPFKWLNGHIIAGEEAHAHGVADLPWTGDFFYASTHREYLGNILGQYGKRRNPQDFMNGDSAEAITDTVAILFNAAARYQLITHDQAKRQGAVLCSGVMNYIRAQGQNSPENG